MPDRFLGLILFLWGILLISQEVRALIVWFFNLFR